MLIETEQKLRLRYEQRTKVLHPNTDNGRGGGKSLAIAELGLMQGHLIKDVLWQEGSDRPGALTDRVSSFRQTNRQRVKQKISGESA